MPLALEVQKACYLFSFSLGCWTLLTLLLGRRGERGGRWAMAAFVALLLLPPLNAYVSLARSGEPLAALQALSIRLTWAYGPLLLLCLRQALCQPLPRVPALLPHALPLALVWAATLAGLDQLLASPGLLLALILQVMAYATAGLLLLRRHRGRLQRLRLAHRNSSYYWLLFLASGLFAAGAYDLLIHALARLGQLPPQALLQAAASALALYVDVIALLAVYQPAWLTLGDEVEPVPSPEPQAVTLEEVPTATPTEVPAETPESRPNVRIVELSPQAARELAERLQQLVHEHKPHLDEDMSLARLAALLDVTPHQLSELLNLHLGSSFYDYLNELRFQDARQLLEQEGRGAGETLTVADIAYRAGFNNRNSFYKVFKDKTGLTPAEYRRTAARKSA
ncbi:AraC family transcriptional regulator [Paucibacter sp. APW11]|uniref:AraC family transcriptional regulator n=1 Tax=Roseateles aquae TaxID=3077235 RepID=A0ABU3PJL4_9BURK|nr:AraC family transcriptional regulator [Paucibacter sp. APW11]MDT9002323.1 AraC family transcriptional regulator [Paucibacter sp. APW11]